MTDHETQSFQHAMEQMVEKFRKCWITGTPEQRAKFSAEAVLEKQKLSLERQDLPLHIKDQLDMIVKETYLNLKKVMASG